MGGADHYFAMAACKCTCYVLQAVHCLHRDDNDFSFLSTIYECVIHDFASFRSFQMTNCYTGTQHSTQTQSTQSSIYQRLVKRMTRFWVETSFEKTDSHITGVIRKLGFNVVCHIKGVVGFQISI